MASSWTAPLGRWYARNRRSLPWRDHPSPYRVWVGEVMSQQTRLQVAIPRFQRFVRRIPDVQALASCPEPVLRELWSGLGYYARARNLSRGARLVVQRSGGELPRTHAQWLSVPGCGPYTAAMVASMCHGERVAAVDGNVIRIWSRLTATPGDLRTGKGATLMGRDLERRIRRVKSPGDFNQAMMELGQRICTPRSPDCHRCPVQACCQAERRGETHLYPAPRPGPAPRDVSLEVVVVMDRQTSRVLVGTREGSPFLRRTVGFPLVVPGGPGESRRLGGKKVGGPFTHTITRHRIQASVRLFRTRAGTPSVDRLALKLGLVDPSWVALSDAPRLVSSTLDARALAILSPG